MSGKVVSGMYRAVTDGIEVSVEPFYLDDESQPVREPVLLGLHDRNPQQQH